MHIYLVRMHVPSSMPLLEQQLVITASSVEIARNVALKKIWSDQNRSGDYKSWQIQATEDLGPAY